MNVVALGGLWCCIATERVHDGQFLCDGFWLFVILEHVSSYPWSGNEQLKAFKMPINFRPIFLRLLIHNSVWVCQKGNITAFIFQIWTFPCWVTVDTVLTATAHAFPLEDEFCVLGVISSHLIARKHLDFTVFYSESHESC